MKTVVKIYTALLLVLFSATTIVAQDLISVKELNGIYTSKDVVVVSTRKAEDYAKLHITGAVNIYHGDLYKDGPVASMLKPASEIAKIFGENGLTADKKIVLYDEGSNKYAGRMYWILKYMGAKDVVILDGNLKAWRAARRPIGSDVPAIKATTFTASVNSKIIVTMADVKAAQSSGKAVIVDVRTPEEFAGTAETTLKKGHIPGAVNFNFEKVMDERGMMLPADQLKALFSAAGITSDKQVILYCESSVRAGIVYLALSSILNYPNVTVYDGAFLEWQSNSSNKVN